MFFNLTCPFGGSTKQRQKIMPVRLAGLCTLAGFSKGARDVRFEKEIMPFPMDWPDNKYYY